MKGKVAYTCLAKMCIINHVQTHRFHQNAKPIISKDIPTQESSIQIIQS